MKSPIFILMFSGSLIACGGNVKNVQCSGVDWSEHGYRTAQSGKSPRDFNRYRDGCGERLEAGATDAYLDGYTRGIVEFCTYDNGYARGYDNKPLGDVCPLEMRTAYQKGHKVGAREQQEMMHKVRKMHEDADMRDAAGGVGDYTTPEL